MIADPWPWPMPKVDADWIYEHVIASYHWATWTGDWRTSVAANERNPECEPGGMGQVDPPPAFVHYCERRVCTLVGPGRIHKDWSRGFPYLSFAVWLPHAVDPYRREPEPDDEVGELSQLELFGAVA